MIFRGKVPDTVALTGCPTSDEGIFLSGLFDVIEFCPYEPSNYVHSPGFILTSVEDRENADAPMWWVDEDDLIAQVDPRAYGRQLAQERWLTLAEDEMFCLTTATDLLQ